MAMVHPNMQQDELAALFSRNLTLEQPAAVAVAVEEPKEQKIVYISQHYNHSAHVARQDAPQALMSPRPASEPPQQEHAAVEAVLRNHGVDASCLSSAQLQLFKTVDDAQKLRLIELWRVCPPTNSLDNPTLAWSMTSVSQEEILAKMRYEQKQQRAEQETIMSLDGTPLTPIQAGDGRWVSNMSYAYMEPYMASGYEEMARREYEESARRAIAESMQPPKDIISPFTTATAVPTYNPAHSDPVYNNSAAAIEFRRQEAMADQYGRIMAMRGYD